MSRYGRLVDSIRDVLYGYDGSMTTFKQGPMFRHPDLAKTVNLLVDIAQSFAEEELNARLERRNDTELIESAKNIADSIGSPWGEGATYESNLSSPELEISKGESYSHLPAEHWKAMVEDIVQLAKNYAETR